MQLLSALRVVSKHARAGLQLGFQGSNLPAAGLQFLPLLLGSACLLLVACLQLIDAPVGLFPQIIQLSFQLSLTQLQHTEVSFLQVLA